MEHSMRAESLKTMNWRLAPLVLLFICCFMSCASDISDVDILIGEAREAPFLVEVVDLGLIDAVETTTITPDTWGKILKLVKEGSLVKEGDPVAWLDTEDLDREIITKENDVLIEKENLKKQIEGARISEVRHNLLIREADARVAFEQVKYEDAQTTKEKKMRLADKNVISKDELETAKLNMLSAELTLKNARNALEKAGKEAGAEKNNRASEVTKARIQLERAENELSIQKDRRNKMVIRIPRDGMVIYKKIWKGGAREKVAVGDQVGPWRPVCELPDLSQMKVVTWICELDIRPIRKKQRVRVKVDAIPDKVFNGTVQEIGAVSKPYDEIPFFSEDPLQEHKQFIEVEIHLDEQDADLKPGLTAEVHIEIYRCGKCLLLPVQAVIRNENEPPVVFREDGTRLEIKTGRQNNLYVEILEGLEEGDRIRLNPEAADQRADQQIRSQ